MSTVTTVLAQDLRPGDVLVSAALGGAWNEELTRVSVYPTGVEVSLPGHGLRLALNEICTVVRRDLPPAA